MQFVKVLLINGPNLNLLGRREPSVYGSRSLSAIVTALQAVAKQQDIELQHIQSNAEHELIDTIHSASATIDCIIINAAALTHTSVAIRDALVGVAIPFIEVHLSNVHAREPFRQTSYLSDVAEGVICGFGEQGYTFALLAAKQLVLDKTNN